MCVIGAYHFRMQFRQSQNFGKFMACLASPDDDVWPSVKVVMLIVGQDLARVRCCHQSAAHTSRAVCHLNAELTATASLAQQGREP